METREENEKTELLRHLGAAYNLARWLTRDDHDAEEIVQEAYMRAYKHFSTFTGSNGRAWLLAIVRNCSYDLLKHNGTRCRDDAFDEQVHTTTGTSTYDPEAALLRGEKAELVRNALTELLPDQREILILRELEGLSYNEIATIMAVPLGTVMSRLSRARNRLHQNLTAQLDSARVYFRQTSSPNGPEGVIRT
jgi:RNA polymerase sigma factor (sigma-70 family)